MPAVINSAPDCITHKEGANTDDLADFILQDNYQDCAGFGTFMPGSTYGDGGAGADTAYMILTWVGIVVMVAVIAYWVIYENRRLIQAALLQRTVHTTEEGPPPQPGQVGDPR